MEDKKMQEIREIKITLARSGNGSLSPRITLPTKWIRELNITEESRNMKVSFDGEKIIIEKI